MERHKCKLCTRTFANGRALGGHMKAHLATLPLPPKPQQLGERTESASSSSSSGEEQEQEVEEKALVYGLRENPKRSFRFADPEFSFVVDAGSVVQDRESETESRNPTRKRSKRNRKSDITESLKQNLEIEKPKLRKPSLVESPAEPEPVSSVSDTSPEEDVAMCLMMLSRDVWMINYEQQDQEQAKEAERSVELLVESKEIKLNNKIRGKHQCGKCNKLFRSYQALSGHKASHMKNGVKTANNSGIAATTNKKIYECPFCFKVFGSGQALGGHKRSHLLNSSTTTMNYAKFETSFIDLNLPAPVEEDDFSVVSSA